ncbi:MAG: hypothetical protein RCG15_03910 [Candidatus Rickettsia vulgarisii]
MKIKYFTIKELSNAIFNSCDTEIELLLSNEAYEGYEKGYLNLNKLKDDLKNLSVKEAKILISNKH